MKVAIVHDYLNQYGGAERVLEVLHDLYPSAPVYTSIFEPKSMPERYRSWDVRTSFMQHLPLVAKHHQPYLLFYPIAFERFDLSGYDLVLSTSSAWAKGVVTPPGTLHICYCHSPMRFAWSHREYLKRENAGELARRFLPFLLSYVRLWDEVSANRVDHFIANSRTVAGRIFKYYRREATVINPPVDTASYKVESTHEDYFLIVSRLVPYKRIDVAVEAFNQLGLPLKVIGGGRDGATLEGMARSNVKFLGRLDDHMVKEHLARCRALVFPGEEDFGIVPLEAQAAGRPVIAFGGGGALETIVEGKTGVFFRQQTPEALAQAVRGFRDELFDPAAIRQHAEKYDVKVFRETVKEFIAEKWKKHTGE